MPITVQCPNCGRPLRVRDDLLGKFVCCPKCKAEFPGAAEAIMEALPAEPPRCGQRTKKESSGGKICALLSFLFGGLSLILCAPSFGCVGVAPLLGLVGMVLGVVGLVLSKDKVPAILALVVSAIGLVSGMTVWVAFLHVSGN